MVITNNYFKMANLFHVVGVCGRRCSGKDTIASILNELYGYENIKISNELKDALKIIFGFSHDQIEGTLKDIVDVQWGISPRQAMQFIGTEVMQYKITELLPDMGRKFWIKAFINKHISGNKYHDKLLVITDVRFIHEYEELKMHLNNDLMMLRVERNFQSHHMKGVDEHASEQEYLKIPVDHIITNNGSKNELSKKLQNIFGV